LCVWKHHAGQNFERRANVALRNEAHPNEAHHRVEHPGEHLLHEVQIRSATCLFGVDGRSA
jgi:hypothetical protein